MYIAPKSTKNESRVHYAPKPAWGHFRDILSSQSLVY